MHKVIEYERGYKNYGAWYGYIPSRHKKRLIALCKQQNKGRKKISSLVCELVGFLLT